MIVGGWFNIAPESRVIELEKEVDVLQQELLEEQVLGGDSFLFVSGKKYRLDGAGVGKTDNTVSLTSFTIPISGDELTMANFGTTGYGTIEPTSDKRKELISWTGITQSSGTKASLTGVTRGLSFVAPYTASTTLQKSHSGGSTFIISDTPQFYDNFASKNNEENINKVWIFDADRLPITDADVNATSSTQFVTLGQLTSVTNQGAATSSETVAGIIEQATLAETGAGTAFDADNPHAINSENATSTISAGGAPGIGFVPTSEADGKLNQEWTDKSEAYTWTGQHNFDAATTTITSATTTFDGTLANVSIGTSTPTVQKGGLSITGDLFLSGNATTTSLGFPDNTNQTTAFIGGNYLHSFTDASTNSGGDSEEVHLATSTIAANTLGANDGMRITSYISTATLSNSSGTLTVKFQFGESEICTIVTGTPAATLASGEGRVELIFVNNNNTSAQIGNCTFTLIESVNGVDSVFIHTAASDSVDFTTSQDLNIRFEAGTNSSMTMQDMVVEVLEKRD